MNSGAVKVEENGGRNKNIKNKLTKQIFFFFLKRKKPTERKDLVDAEALVQCRSELKTKQP